MPQRSTVSQLPAEVRDDLDRRLIDGGFSDYTGLREWLFSRGYEISRSAIHRHGKLVEQRIEQIRIATEEAKAIEKAVEDDGESIAFATLVQCQVMLHRIAMAAEDGDPKLACQQARALADLTRAGQSLRRERKLGREEGLREAVETASKRADGSPKQIIAALRELMEGPQ